MASASVRRSFMAIPAACLLAALLACTPTAARAGDGAGTGRWLAVSDSARRVYVLEQGRGETIVFVHGTLLDHRCWSGVTERLRHGFRTVSYSRWGHYPARDASPLRRYSVDQHAADLVELLRRIAPHGAHLVGHSYGGVVAARVALDHPELVRSLVLIEPYTLALVTSQESRDSLIARRRRAMTEAATASGDDRFRLFFAGIMGDPGFWAGLPEARQREFRDNAATFAGLYNPQPAFGCEEVRRLSMPVCVMEGARSFDVFREIAAGWKSCLPTVRLVTVPDVSHLMMWERPQELADSIAVVVRNATLEHH
jgi:pimeloyl-ACP methyl ester carboxylesterase